MVDKINLKPAEEPEKEEKKEVEPPMMITKNEAVYLLNEIADICTVFQASFNLPETTDINKEPEFYILEILRALKEFNIIVD